MKPTNILRVVLRILIATVTAVAIAYVSVDWAMRQPSKSLRNGPWETDLTIGSEAANMYARALCAKHGIWALTSSEVIYYAAKKDSNGEPLRCDRTYRINGKDLDTRWWSITAYANDHFIPNSDDRYSYASTTIQHEADGSWIVLASPTRKERNWLPLGDSPVALCFVLRCYNPGHGIYNSLETVSLPSIDKEEKR